MFDNGVSNSATLYGQKYTDTRALQITLIESIHLCNYSIGGVNECLSD